VTPKRRVLFLFNAFSTDAPSALTSALAIGAKGAGYEVVCAAWSRGGPLECKLNAAGIRAVVLGGGMIRAAARLAHLIRDFQPHIIHSILVRPNLGMALARLIGTRTDAVWVAADHGIHEWSEKSPFVGHLTHAILPVILSNADAVVTVSENNRRALAGVGISANKLQVIQNGVNLRRFYPRSRAGRQEFIRDVFKIGIQPEIFLIGSAGNLRHLKGYDIFVRAAQIVVQTEPRARFVIWGDGPERNRLQAQVGKSGLEDTIHLCGHETELEHLLPLLDLYVQPSRTESFGLAAAEAMACGIAVVASDTGGLQHLIEHEQSGLKFRPGDAACLADNILLLIKRNRKRKLLAEAGRLRVMERFSQQGMISAQLSLYDLLLKEKGQ